MLEWYWILFIAALFTLLGYSVAVFAIFASDNEEPQLSSSEWKDIIRDNNELGNG